MIDGKMLSQLELATDIPAGSLHMVEMGDGSGTKVVTQETLVEETGNALKIGDLKKLETENKESLVGAINEAKKSGGNGGTVDILDTPEEVEANTEAEKVAGALAVKEMFSALNDNLTFPDNVGFYLDVKDGVRGYNTDPQRGADTFCPFKTDYREPIKLASSINSANSYSRICTDISGYENFTEDNFLLVFKSIKTEAQGVSVNSGDIKKTYDPKTGKLTVSAYYLGSGLKYSSGSSLRVSLTYDLYLVT